jgi:hypothetical protein
MLVAQDLLFLLVGEAGLGSFVGVGNGALADTSSADEDLRLQKQFVLPRFALDVVDRVLVLDVGIEAKNHMVLLTHPARVTLLNHRQKIAGRLKAHHKMAQTLDTVICQI